MKLAALILLTFCTSISIAKPKEDYFSQVNTWPTNPEKWIAEIKWADPSMKLEVKSVQKNAVRSAASSDQREPSWYEAKMSDAYKQARKEFLEVKTPDQLDALLVKLDAKFDTFPTDLKFFAAQIIPLRTLRGIVWKTVPAVKNTKIVHSSVLTIVKQFAVAQKLFFPAPQWTAGMDYITQPYMEDGKLATRFNNEGFMQGYSASIIYPALVKANDRLLSLSMGNGDVVFDSQFIFGVSKSPESIDQYKLLGEVERWATISAISAAMAQITMNRAYSMEGSFKMSTAIGKEYGIDSFFSKVDGVPAEKVVSIIRSNSFPNWGSRFSDGKAHLALARKHMKDAVIYAQRMVAEMESRQGSEEYFADANFPIPYTRGTKYQLAQMLEMLDRKTEVRSAATGEIAVVDVPKFFEDPPDSLKSLYAVHFEQGPEMIPFKVNGVQVDEYRNYLKGRPDGWNLAIYKKYFPDVKTDKDLMKKARVLSQAWGAQMVVMPLTTYFQ